MWASMSHCSCDYSTFSLHHVSRITLGSKVCQQQTLVPPDPTPEGGCRLTPATSTVKILQLPSLWLQKYNIWIFRVASRHFCASFTTCLVYFITETICNIQEMWCLQSSMLYENLQNKVTKNFVFITWSLPDIVVKLKNISVFSYIW